MSIVIRLEQEADMEAIWNVNRAAFETDAEANLVDALRVGGFVEISLVAELDGEIVGVSARANHSCPAAYTAGII